MGVIEKLLVRCLCNFITYIYILCKNTTLLQFCTQTISILSPSVFSFFLCTVHFCIPQRKKVREKQVPCNSSRRSGHPRTEMNKISLYQSFRSTLRAACLPSSPSPAEQDNRKRISDSVPVFRQNGYGSIIFSLFLTVACPSLNMKNRFPPPEHRNATSSFVFVDARIQAKNRTPPDDTMEVPFRRRSRNTSGGKNGLSASPGRRPAFR